MAFNTYRNNIPIAERIYKDFAFRLRALLNYIHHGFKKKNVVFFPEYPTKRTIIFKILRKLRYNITNNANVNADLIINWENVTIRNNHPVLENLSEKQPVINIRCKNIGKKHVDEIHHSVFGYGTMIDPLTYTGLCVKKSDANAKHDGIEIECPIQKDDIDEIAIYQIIINNKISDETVYDIRVPILKQSIPFLYIKYRPINNRFSNTNSHTDLVWDRSKYINEQEVVQIQKFCEKIGLEYGELDVLRNKDDNKLYIIDVNFTPWGPPNHLSRSDRKKAIKVLSKSFKSRFLISSK